MADYGHLIGTTFRKICMGQTVWPIGAIFDPSIGRPDGLAHTKTLWDWMAGLVIHARQIGHHLIRVSVGNVISGTN
jgi:hypothetical protein